MRQHASGLALSSATVVSLYRVPGIRIARWVRLERDALRSLIGCTERLRPRCMPRTWVVERCERLAAIRTVRQHPTLRHCSAGRRSDSAVLAVPGVQSKPQLHVTHIHGHTWAQRLDHTGPLSTSGGPERGSEATCPFLDRFSGRPVQILAGLASVNCLNSRWKRCLLFLASDFRQTCRHRRFT